MSDFEDAYNAGRDAAPVPFTQIKDLPVGLVLEGYALTDIAKYLPAPVDKRGVVTLFTPQSFVAYVDAYRDSDTLILADVQTTTLTAILDYHRVGDGAPRHGAHRATFTCRKTKEWETWTAIHKKSMWQADFAQFLEDNLPDVAAPAGAELLTMARTLEVKKDVQFASSIRLSDGHQQLTYNEIVEGSTNRGQMRIVDEVTLALAPFEGSDKFSVTARLRFRLQDGKIGLWFDLLRTHKVLEEAFEDVRKVIAAGLPDARIVDGKVGQ